jgi:FOG: Ankyrin repeat
MNTDKYYKSLLRRVEFLEAKLNVRRRAVYEASVDGATKLYEDSNWTVYRITTPEAARAIGKRASWDITAGRKSGQIFNDTIKNYNLDGGFYFYIAKNNPKEQYCVLQTKGRKIKAIWDVTGDHVDFLDVDLPVVPEVNLNGITDDDRLIKAAMDDDAAAAKKLLSSGADPNAVLRSGHPLICVAAGDLNYPMVKLLLKFGADPNMYDKVSGVTPIQAALHNMNWDTNKASSGKNAVIKELLSYGAEVNKETLKKLCSDGNVLIVKQIIANSDNVKPDSSLLWAASEFMTKGNLELVEFLLKSGADPNTQNSYGETLLQRALRWDQKNKSVAKYVKLLRQYGAE